MVSLLWRFCALTKAGAVGFGPGLKPLKGLLAAAASANIDPDGAKGLVGVEGGPPAGLGGRAGSDIDGNLSEDASSDKVRGVKDVKIPKISKIRKRGEAKHAIPQAGFGFFYRRSSHNPKP